MNPLVSVIITVYNAKEYFINALESVLDQTYKNIEIIIIDDGSTDFFVLHSIKSMSSKHDNIFYFYKKNGGPSSARNMGINLSNGEFICFLDPDDTYIKNKIEIEMMIFKNLSEKYSSVSGGIYLNGKKKKPKIFQGDSFPIILKNFLNLHGTPSHLFRKSSLVKIGGYNEKLFVNEDRNLLLRLSKIFFIKTHDKIVANVNKNEMSITSKSNFDKNLFNKHKNILESYRLIETNNKKARDIINRDHERIIFAYCLNQNNKINFIEMFKLFKYSEYNNLTVHTLKYFICNLIETDGFIGDLLYYLVVRFKKRRIKNVH